jgi:hypothetical protein
MMNEQSLPPLPQLHDALGLWLQVIALVQDKGAAKLLAQLERVAGEAKEQRAAADKAMSDLVTLREQTEEEVHRLKEEAAHRIAVDRDEHDARITQRIAEVTAREKRSKELEEAARRDLEKAAAAKKETERRLRMLETGAA